MFSNVQPWSWWKLLIPPSYKYVDGLYFYFHIKSKCTWNHSLPQLELWHVPLSGGFYSDTLGYVADGCKKCPNGSYVAYDKKPGKSVLDCKTCPDGNNRTCAFWRHQRVFKLSVCTHVIKCCLEAWKEWGKMIRIRTAVFIFGNKPST